MKKFTDWFIEKMINEENGDVRQIKLIKLEPNGSMNFELVVGGQPTGRMGTSSKITGSKIINDMGDGTVLVNISTESGTSYMAKVDRNMAKDIERMAQPGIQRTRTPAKLDLTPVQNQPPRRKNAQLVMTPDTVQRYQKYADDYKKFGNSANRGPLGY